MFLKRLVWLTIILVATISLFLLNIPDAEGEREKANVAIDMPIFYDQPQEQTQPKQEPRTPQASISLSEIQEYAKSRVDEGQWEYFNSIVIRESNWNHLAINKSSGACGLPQSLPCSKLGDNWQDPYHQIDWMVQYIENRYGSPYNAWVFWNNNHWY